MLLSGVIRATITTAITTAEPKEHSLEAQWD
jgi:hypothetical protein